MKAITSKELNSDDIDKITMYSDSSQAKKFIQGDPTLGKKLLELSENDSVGQYFSLCPVDKYEWLMALEDRPSAKSMEFVKEWLGVKEIENIVDLAKRIDTENKEIFKTNKLIVYEDDKKETVDVGASIVNYEGLKQDYAAKKSEWKEKFKDMSYFDVDFYFMLKENLDVDRGFIKEARNYLLPQNVDGPKPEKIIELAKELMGKFDYETYDSLFKTENETRYHQIDLLDGLMEIGYDLEEIKELSGKITNLAYLNRVATTMEFDKFPKLEVDELSMLINSDTSLIHARQYFDAGLVGEDTDHQYPSFLVPVFVAHEMSPSDLQHFRETTDIQQNYWEKTIRDPKKFKFERFVDDFRKRYNKDTK